MGDPTKAARDSRIVKWMKSNERNKFNDHVRWPEEVWWGYWFNGDCADGPLTPPDVMFPTEEQALGYANMMGKQYDTYVGPCVLDIQFRDNGDVPE